MDEDAEPVASAEVVGTRRYNVVARVWPDGSGSLFVSPELGRDAITIHLSVDDVDQLADVFARGGR